MAKVKKRFSLRNLILIFPVLIFSYSVVHSESHDSLIIKDIKISPDLKSENIIGVQINIQSTLVYSEFHNKVPSSSILKVVVLDTKGNPIKSAFKGSKYNIDGKVGFETDNFPHKDDFKIFIPYYILDLPMGKHSLTLNFYAFVKDTSITSPKRPVLLAGLSSIKFIINKPETRKFKTMVRGVRVASSDFKGRSWDYGAGTYPDIRYQIELRNEVFTDAIFISTFMKNSLSAALLDFSNEIIISEGDKITFSVYDKDLIFDDMIGRKTFKLENLKKAVDSRKEFKFGKVTYCIFDLVILK